MNEVKVWAVVPAAGKGARMGSEIPKQYLQLAGKTVLAHTLDVLSKHPRISGIAVALAAHDELWPQVASNLAAECIVVDGGKERCHSVLAGIAGLLGEASDNDWVLVHDAARPCLRGADIDRMLHELGTNAVGGILAVPVRDTLKRAANSGEIEDTVDRTGLWHALTPQMFRLGQLRAAIEQAIAAGLLVTDEAQAIEAAGLVPHIVEGHADNLKITHPADLELAAIFLKSQGRG